MNKNQHHIDLSKCFRILLQRKRVFIKVLPIVFVLACIWIFPQPRYYNSSVALAPEYSSESSMSGISSLASSFGFNIGAMGAGTDAIYPTLYPELFQSPEFTVSLYNIEVTDAEGTLTTDYYTYLKKHQKENPLTAPFRAAKRWVVRMLKDKKKGAGAGINGVDPFRMSEEDYILMEIVQQKIICTVDKKTEVITISVTDQDPLIAATMADSVKSRLQDFIVMYRTSKARMDATYYQALADSALVEYKKATDNYSRFCDKHNNAIRQSVISQRSHLETEMAMKLNAYTAISTQLQTMKAKIQESTPAFTVLKSATTPTKPAGPKRVLFVVGMCFLATLVVSIWLVRKEIFGIGNT